MARTRTLAQMRDEALELADMEDSTFVTSATVHRRVNQSIAHLWFEMVNASPDQYVTTVTVTTVADTAVVDIDTTSIDIFRLYGVDAKRNGEWGCVDRIDFAKRNNYDANHIWSLPWGQGPIYYMHRGGSLHLFPTPDGAYNLRLWYVPAATVLTTTSATFNGINGWEDYVVHDVAAWLRIKEESDPSALFAERDRILERVKMAAHKRDETGPKRVRDVRRRWTKRDSEGGVGEIIFLD